jgi:nucleoside-diphosphate kinase
VVLLKPDTVRRHLIGEILARFERAGLSILELHMGKPERGFWEIWYADVRERHGEAVFQSQVNFMFSGPVVAVVLAGRDAIEKVRMLIGATQPRDARPGTIRGDFGSSLPETLVHASDSLESWVRECKLVRSLIW